MSSEVRKSRACVAAAAALAWSLAGCAPEVEDATLGQGAGAASERPVPVAVVPVEVVRVEVAPVAVVPAEREPWGAASEEAAEILAGGPPPPAQYGEPGGAECMAPSGAPYVAPSC